MEKKEYEYCLRCGRKLKNPQARERGYGSVCILKLRVEGQRKLFDATANLHSSTK